MRAEGVKAITRATVKATHKHFLLTWQGWGWRVGQDRGHFPASKDKSRTSDKEKRTFQVEGLARCQACSTACPRVSKEPVALRRRIDKLRFVF